VTLDGQPATSVGGQGFEGEIEAPAGTSTFEIQATDASGNPRTSTYEFDAGSGGASYDYDANGNLVEKVENGETWTYEWNAENQLTRVLKNAGEVATFRYDPLGRRIEKVGGGVTTRCVYDAEDVLYKSAGGSTTTYFHGPRIDEPLQGQTAAGNSYYHADALGSIVARTDAAGAVETTWLYDAWGRIEPGEAAAEYGFTGREWDPEIGLYYYRARYYDPDAGRFVSEDPLRFLVDLNFYRYVQGRPTVWSDPFGLEGGHEGFLSDLWHWVQETATAAAGSVVEAVAHLAESPAPTAAGAAAEVAAITAAAAKPTLELTKITVKNEQGKACAETGSAAWCRCYGDPSCYAVPRIPASPTEPIPDPPADDTCE
jgi:RHS repeat-associated protein